MEENKELIDNKNQELEIDESKLKRNRLIFWIIFIMIITGISYLIFWAGFF